MIFVSVYTSLLFAVLWWNHNVNCAIQECSLVVAALLQHLYLVITHHLIFARALPSLARSRFGLKDLLHPMNLPFKFSHRSSRHFNENISLGKDGCAPTASSQCRRMQSHCSVRFMAIWHTELQVAV